ncbi:MAG: lytic murein transglycosylase B [Betaproteobacteria bacterium]|nr:lytic murein transglycosylase B [Betaproteobacteria bacterium]
MKSKALAWLAALALTFASAAEPLAVRAQPFIRQMADKHGFDAGELEKLFADLEPDERVIKLISPPDAGGRPPVYWSEYRDRHINGRIIRAGMRFLRDHSGLLARAEDEYGVPRTIIAAIIGIETRYGSYLGDFLLLRSLATLGFDYPPRAEFFLGELEQLLLLAREMQISPADLQGSYAGAFGMPQFLPTSARNWAVDFDGDGTVDLFSAADAIGSVANFLKQHGWARKTPVAFKVSLQSGATPERLLGEDIIPEHDQNAFAAAGIIINFGSDLPYQGLMTLVDLVEEDQEDEYRAGTGNYYVLTRYNRSNKYAMAVLDLADEFASRLK